MFLSPLFLLFFPRIGVLLMVVAIVGIVYWHKAHEWEIRAYHDMRVREMEHQRKMRELELELEKEKNRRGGDKVA